jgi:hypothetical protein
MYLIANIIVCVGALAGYIYGEIKLFRAGKNMLYAQMIALSLLCITYGRLYHIVRLVTDGSITESFQLGFLGALGSLIFFFASNFGTVDSLVDDGSKKLKKYRLIALAAPAAAVVLYVCLFLLGEVAPLWRVQGAVLTLLVIPTSYFNLKHLIFPDVEGGFVKCLRPYNLLVLIYTASMMMECFAMSRSKSMHSIGQTKVAKGIIPPRAIITMATAAITPPRAMDDALFRFAIRSPPFPLL